MPATELVTKSLGKFSKYDVYEPTGNVGNTFVDTNAWLTQKISAGITNIKNVTTSVIVCKNNGHGWAAFDEPSPAGNIRTIFEIK